MAEAAATDRYDAAVALDAAGRSDAAIDLLRELLSDAPEHVMALALLGTLLAIEDRHLEAYAALSAAAQLAPDSGAIHNNLGNLLGTMGRHDEGVAAFERSLQLRPQDGRTAHNLGKLLRRAGRPEEALVAFENAVVWAPDRGDAWYSRASLMAARSYYTEAEEHRVAAAQAWRDALAHGVSPVEAGFALAALGEAEAPPIAPKVYVQGLFDRYASKFDHHLRELLDYTTPEQLCALLLRASGDRMLDIVDLGCGTGLCAPLLRRHAATLVGVDLSTGMLAEAGKRGLYDALVQADVVDHLRGQADGFDAAIAADVLVYIGDLAPVFGAAAGALRSGGLLAVSVEHNPGEGYKLLATRRYAHARDYVRTTADAAGLVVEAAEPSVLRREGAGHIDGTLFVMRRP